MNTLEVGTKLVALCREGNFDAAMDALYAKDITSVEAGGPSGMSRESKGLEAVIAKGKWWSENHTVHATEVDGPYPHGDRFIVKFTMDITFKPENRRFNMQEMALYTVKDGKIVREEFFYVAG